MPATVQSGTLQTFINCNGNQRLVETIQQPGESTSDFEDRHLAAIDAAEAACDGTATFNQTTYTTPVDCNGTVTDVVSGMEGSAPDAAFFAQHNNDVRAAVNDCD